MRSFDQRTRKSKIKVAESLNFESLESRLAMSASPATGVESRLADNDFALVQTSTESRPTFMQAVSVGNTGGSTQTFTKIVVKENGRDLRSRAVVTTNSSLNFQALATNRSNRAVTTQPSFTWQNTLAPAVGAATLQATGNNLNIRFSRAGSYQFRVTAGNVSTTFTVQVNAAFAGLDVTPNGVTLEPGQAQNYSVRAVDQFGNTVNQGPYTTTWTASGGSIASSGRFVAGQQAGNYSVTASALGRTKTVQVTVQAPKVTDTNIEGLVNYFNQDQRLDRNEVIYLIKSTVQDNSVSSAEFSSLQYVLRPSSGFNMPEHVRSLGTDVVFGNTANQRHQGQTLGNMRVGSTADQVNKLVDKWFYGSDVPAIGNPGIASYYQWSHGTLFNQTPKLLDTKQGSVGDCYFLASLSSIAAKNPTAIQNMFIDNGDNTFTVRFYTGEYGYQFSPDGSYTSGFENGTGSATYVTVNRLLPGTLSGRYVFSNMGNLLSSTTTPIWTALAEKAYAQWNETGRAGRDNTNTYQGISGGWMTDVNAQVLGRNSSTLWNLQDSTAKSRVIQQFQAGEAVTVSTPYSVSSSEWIAGHAYVLSNYNAATDRFDLFNPWGGVHRYGQSWEQIQANADAIVLTDRLGSSPGSRGNVSSSFNQVAVNLVWSSGSDVKPNSVIQAAKPAVASMPASSDEATPTEKADFQSADSGNQVTEVVSSKTQTQENSRSSNDFDSAFEAFDLQLI